jgi:hypothetical protein
MLAVCRDSWGSIVPEYGVEAFNGRLQKHVVSSSHWALSMLQLLFRSLDTALAIKFRVTKLFLALIAGFFLLIQLRANARSWWKHVLLPSDKTKKWNRRKPRFREMPREMPDERPR